MYTMSNTLAIGTINNSLLSQVIYIRRIDELKVHLVLIMMVNQRVVSMDCELTSCEHDYSAHHQVVVYSFV